MKSEVVFGIAGILFFSILILGIVIAQEDAADTKIKDTKRNDFNARLEHISCRIDLTKKQIDLLSGVDSNLSSYKTALDADVAKLKEFADVSDNKGFNDYLTKTLKDDLKKAVMAVKDAKGDFRKSNLTKEEKATLRDNHKTAISAFADCVSKADKDLVDARTEHLGKWIEKWNNIISKMKEKGFDTTGMESVVSDAQTKLLPALDAIKSASTKETRKTAMENARNLHLHLWARFEIARIKSYLSFIETDAVAKGYQTDVNVIKEKLSGATNLASEGKKYGPGEFESTWKAIRDTAQLLKDLNKKVKG